MVFNFHRSIYRNLETHNLIFTLVKRTKLIFIDTQIFWLTFHVFILVYWLGADISVFYGSTQLTNTKNSIETRLVIVKIISFVNWFPNIANILIFPVGIMLLAGLGYFTEVGKLIYLVWFPFLFWFFFIAGSITQRGTSMGKVYLYLDSLMRILLISFVYIGISFLYFSDVIFIEDWVLLKFYLYGYILICGFGIKYSYSGFAPAFKNLIENGPSIEIEKKLSASRKMVKPWVLALWLGLVLLSYIGISKPDF